MVGGIFEGLNKEIKKTLHKTLGQSNICYGALESVIMDTDGNLNNQPLTYVNMKGDREVLTPNVIMWGQDLHPVEDIEYDSGRENVFTA